MVDILILIGGFIALIFGADKLVDAASSLASKMGISHIVIGLTIVAFGTSAPELVVNLFASINGNLEIVLGNILGSNIFNTLGILGIVSIIYPLSVKTNTTWLEIPLCLLAAITIIIIASDVYFDNAILNYISRADGIMLLLFFTVFLVYTISISVNGTIEAKVETKNYSNFQSIFYIILGLMGLIIGGKLIVMSATNIAQSFGFSERIIGLTVVSIGTSLPELATSVVAARKKNVDIAIGNIVGSNIFNIFFILGISAIVNPFEIKGSAYLDIAMNIMASLLLFIFIVADKGRQLGRRKGIILLMLYVIYLVYLLI